MNLEAKQPLKGKTIIWLGDSITHDNLFVGSVQEKTGLTTVANYGFFGLCFFSVADLIDQSAVADVDVVNIFAGTNDYGGGRRLGSISDARSDYDGIDTSFYFEVFSVINKLLTLKQSLKIVVCTPLKRGEFEKQPIHPAPNAAGHTLDAYAQAIRDVCALFPVPVCDLFEMKEFDIGTLHEYTKDNLHINRAGAEVVAGRMVAAFNQISIDDSDIQRLF